MFALLIVVIIIVLLVCIAKGSSSSERQKANYSYSIGLMKRCDQCATYVELQAIICSSCSAQAFTAIDRKALLRKRQIIVAVGVAIAAAIYLVIHYS